MAAKRTPAAQGYSFPPEWYPHKATWISWPRPEGISFPGRYHEAIEDIAGLIRVLVESEQVHLNVPNENYERIVREFLKARQVPLRRVFFHYIPPTKPGRAIMVRRFCCAPNVARPTPPSSTGDLMRGAPSIRRGMRMTPCRRASPKSLSCRCLTRALSMEGGAVDFNGAGTILTTTSCLLNKNRNRGLSKTRIEKYLRDYYGQKHVVWLGEGIEGDDTDGHIDDLARFVDERTIAIGIETNKRDPNYAILQKARRALDQGPRSGRPPVRHSRTADAKADVDRRPACAGHLHEFLFRQSRASGTRPSARATAIGRRWRSCRSTSRIAK